MSTSTTTLSGIVKEDKLWIISTYTQLSAATLWLLDFVQTLPMEIEAVWSGKPTGAAAMFLVNRYVFGVFNIVALITQSPFSASDKTCNALNKFILVMVILTVITTNLLFALRVYAISGRSRIILAIALTILLGRLAMDIWQATPSLDAGVSTIVPGINASIVAAVLALAFDVYVFGVTVYKTYGNAMQVRKQGRKGLTGVLLRDGTLYFFSVSIVAAGNLTLELVSTSSAASNSFFLVTTVLSPYFAVLPNLLVNRLYLNLQTVYLPGSTVAEHGITLDSDIVFTQNRFLGSVGAPIDSTGWSAHSEKDEEAMDCEISKEQDDSTGATGDGTSTLVPVVSGPAPFKFPLRGDTHTNTKVYEGGGHGDIELVRIAGLSSSGTHMGTA